MGCVYILPWYEFLGWCPA
uniref:Uncharacterized protein n=1 Tax=Arundo donax TaxID=35708 RepID=A0A0A8Z6N8_ARUDO